MGQVIPFATREYFQSSSRCRGKCQLLLNLHQLHAWNGCTLAELYDSRALGPVFGSH